MMGVSVLDVENRFSPDWKQMLQEQREKN